MSSPYTRAPHQGGGVSGVSDSPHAALLIDFDNVTMGMRSDLSKELKTLLKSDVIHGKVSVQRAYADWRRYPQYIVPLSEASVDLIFAPAYGSNKKNATDIRMAIDAVEMVFTRPEIGTFILLTGDADFSSLVLKLKEYGKYVIGVGIQESTSDILVQNCDEYYSYTSLSGLRKTTDSDPRAADPWVLVKDALKRMTERNDVMRSDRLKQVMQEIDPTFDEGGLGFSKFSRFLAEASSRGVVRLQKLENGQYEVGAGSGRARAKNQGDDREGRRGRGRGRDRAAERTADRAPDPENTADRDADGAPNDEKDGRDKESRSRDRGTAKRQPEPQTSQDGSDGDPLQGAYALMTRSLDQLREAGRDPVRDSDVKRKMLELDGSFDETELGFPKFSKFLAHAEDHSVIRLLKTDAGNYEVTRADKRSNAGHAAKDTEHEAGHHGERDHGQEERHAERTPESTQEARMDERSEAPTHAPAEPSVVDIDPTEFEDVGRRLGPRRGSTRRRPETEAPDLFAGQMVPSASVAVEPGFGDETREAARINPDDVSAEGSAADFDASALGLPTETDAIIRYLTHRYRGVGEKTAESLVDRFGADLFQVLRDDPDAIKATVTPKRAEQVIDAWRVDYERRSERRSGDGSSPSERGEGRPGRRGSRRRG